ncbi:MAG: indolepyruvate ferredoxin oxidoreductase family protein [Acidimicrobiia bacterium]|nr:indolepyruvate ferredoxin oxidoreductase family protein [Acidimicrobiia bacterium]
MHTAGFISGYPGSPLGGLGGAVDAAAAAVPGLPIVHQPGVNEELAVTSVMGSQLAPGRPDATYEGVVGLWYGKAPGLDRACDALRHGVFAGSHTAGGAIVIVGDDPACKSSTMPSSSDATLVDLHMPILYPGTVAECLELGLHAVAMSRATGLWSSMKIVAPIADGTGMLDLPALDREIVVPVTEIDGEPWHCTPSAEFLGAARMLDVEHEFRDIRLPLARRYGIENDLNRIRGDRRDAWIGLVATGFTYSEVIEALRRLGLGSEQQIADAGIRLLQLRMPVPFDTDLVREFASGLTEIVVVEEKNPTLEWLIKDALYGGPDQPPVVGKTQEDGRTLMPAWGPLDAHAMIGGLRERLAQRLDERLAPAHPPSSDRPEHRLIPLAVNRTPFFCSGCPHNNGTKVPDDALVGAGTGCHGMTLLMDAERVGEGIGITAMGNEGAQWVGMAPFVEGDHLFQNFGDGTYLHSGQLAIQHCIGAGAHVTFKILFNGTVAMTGGQDPAAPVGVPELATILLAQGVSRVAVTTDDLGGYDTAALPASVRAHDRRDIIAVQEQLRATPGVTVLIHDQYCAAELRRDRKRGLRPTPTRRIVINHRICEGCGDCGDVSNCLSVMPIETPLGRKTTIDQASCNYDETCLQGDCPAFMVVETGSSSVRSAVPSPPGPLPDPVPVPTPDDVVRVRMAGIGGTGVVTAAQILATAAMLDGWETHGLDQTGLSQKAGPVISDVTLARADVTTSNIIGERQADVLIAFDSLVAAGDGAIDAADPSRTTVIASAHRTPTGRMITHPEIAYPEDAIRSRLDARSIASHHLDAAALADRLAGGAAGANIVLLGVAVQTGLLPVSPASIERAITLNGVAVERNTAAFGWGRRWAHDADDVERLASDGERQSSDAVTVPALPPRLAARVDALVGTDELGDTLRMLTADLVGYQNAAYAARFLDGVAAARDAERRNVSAETTALTEAVARSLHKLMAYKDEYEVARLMLLPEASAAVAEAVGGTAASVTWQLHPPTIRALGRQGKTGFPSWTRPMFRALAKGKRLRGTPADPFGRAALRGLERELPGAFLDAMDHAYRSLDATNLDAAIAIARLPDQVRGYETLKERRIAEYRASLATALAQFTI